MFNLMVMYTATTHMSVQPTTFELRLKAGQPVPLISRPPISDNTTKIFVAIRHSPSPHPLGGLRRHSVEQAEHPVNHRVWPTFIWRARGYVRGVTVEK